MKIEHPFANFEGSSAVEQNSRESLLNMFAEAESSGRTRLVRRQRPGVQTITAKTGEKRCVEHFDGVDYAVIDNKFYQYNGATLTERGTLSTSTGPCTMVADELGNILISDGANGFHWNGTTFSTVTAQTAIGPVTLLAGRAVYTNGDQFWWSSINDMTSWSALDFATPESSTDDAVRAFKFRNQLWLFGTLTTEVWQLSSGSTPFLPQNTILPRGCGAALSVATEDNSLLWMGEDFIVYRDDGYRPQRISNHSIERLISEVPENERGNARAFVYTDQGHKFYTLTFPGYLTVQYNMATQFWNKARTYGENEWTVVGPTNSRGSYILSDAGVSKLSRSVNTDDGTYLERGGVSAPIAAGNDRLILNSLMLDVEVGRMAEGVEPQIMLRVARDGETFGNERWRSMGTTGDYNRRVVWRSLGMGRKIACEIMVTDDVDFAIVGSFLNVDRIG